MSEQTTIAPTTQDVTSNATPATTLLNPVITPEIKAQLETKINNEYAEAAKANSTEQSASTSASTEEWFVDEGMKGIGKKPEYLLPKFKTQAAQAKAYADLEKKFGDFKGAPETYVVPEGINKEDILVKEFLEDAKQGGASQDFVSKAFDKYMKTQVAPQIDTTKELEKLGAQAPEITKRVTIGLSKYLNADEMKLACERFKTAEDILLLDKIIGKIPQVSPISPTQQNITPLSVEKINSEVDYERFKNDEVYRNHIRSLYEKAIT